MMPNNWEIGDFRTCKNDVDSSGRRFPIEKMPTQIIFRKFWD